MFLFANDDNTILFLTDEIGILLREVLEFSVELALTVTSSVELALTVTSSVELDLESG